MVRVTTFLICLFSFPLIRGMKTGALKQAQVGVALLSGGAPVGKKKKQPHAAEKEKEKEKEKGKEKSKETPTDRQLRQTLAALEQADDAQPHVVRLGDASIAAPFSARSTSVECTLRLIRQGRCTLVTTFQMYKILALNCLVSAYSLSVLTLEGIKFGEIQATVGGLAIAMFFAFLSFSKPLEKLSAERPHTSVFSAYMLLSIAGQFALHLYTIMAAVALAQPFAVGASVGAVSADAGADAAAVAAAAEARSPDGKFAPSVLNSVVFLVAQSTTVATFAVNYSGRPFMQSLRENKALFRALAAVALFIAACALNVSHDLLELCELVPFPSDEVRVHRIGAIEALVLAGEIRASDVFSLLFRHCIFTNTFSLYAFRPFLEFFTTPVSHVADSAAFGRRAWCMGH